MTWYDVGWVLLAAVAAREMWLVVRSARSAAQSEEIQLVDHMPCLLDRQEHLFYLFDLEGRFLWQGEDLAKIQTTSPIVILGITGRAKELIKEGKHQWLLTIPTVEPII